MRLLNPKNGEYLVALIAGGPADRARELTTMLSERRGIEARYHWDYDSDLAFRKPIPDDVDFVLLLKSMIGHSKSSLVVQACKKRGIPVISTPHKWSSIQSKLTVRFGITAAKKEVQPIPLHPPPPAPSIHEEEMRVAVLQKDTIVLIREIQARLRLMGIDTVLIDRDTITLGSPVPKE